VYTKEEREGILWEFHQSGMNAKRACEELPMFPTRDVLRRWLRLEARGVYVAREMPDRPSRMHCSHKWGDHARRRGRGGGSLDPVAGEERREPALADEEGREEQTTWRDWGAELPGDPAERARMTEVKLAEALAVLDVLKAPGPGSLTNREKFLAGEAARAQGRGVRLADVTETLSIPKSTYLDQAAAVGRPDPKAALRARVRASFESSGGAFGAESVWADLRRGEGEPVGWRDLEEGDERTPVIVSEKVVRAIMAEEGLVARKTAQMRRRSKFSSYRGERGPRPANLPLREDGTHDFRAGEPGLLCVTDVTEFALDGFKAYLSPAIDCFDGRPVCWRVSLHPDKELAVGTLEGLVAAVRPTESRPLVVHTDGGAVYMSDDWAAACASGNVTRSMSRKARSPDNARCEGFFGTLKSDFFEGEDWAGVTFGEFRERLDAYIEWYRDAKPKKSLGWRTTAEYRRDLGYGCTLAA
jgi:putative transposase